jgi:hypothetical protein
VSGWTSVSKPLRAWSRADSRKAASLSRLDMRRKSRLEMAALNGSPSSLAASVRTHGSRSFAASEPSRSSTARKRLPGAPFPSVFEVRVASAGEARAPYPAPPFRYCFSFR